METNPWKVENLEGFRFYCCPECDSKHLDVSEFVEHALDHHPKSREIFESKDVEDDHDDIFEPLVDLDEDTCDFSNVIVTPEEPLEQVENVTKIEIPEIQCAICLKRLSSKDELIEHLESEHDEEIFDKECQFCGARFKKTNGLSRHIHGVHKEFKQGSRKSSRRSKVENSIISEDVKSEVKSKVKPESILPPAYKCDICDFVTYMRDKIPKHNEEMHKIDGVFICHLCNISFHSCSGLAFHNTSIHMEGEFKLKCPECQKGFRTKRDLNRHLESHTRPKPEEPQLNVICELCGKVCATGKKLKSHMKAVHGEKKVECDRCDKLFVTFKDLKHHLKSSHDVYDITMEQKKGKCDKCDIQFEDPENFDIHLKECIEDTKEFKCKFCDTIWVSHLSLKHHIVVKHEKILHCCDICNFVTKEQAALKSHKLSWHEDIHDFVCHLCGSSHKKEIHLKYHLCHKHGIGEKKYKCDICSKVFFYKDTLKQHVQQVHIRDKKFKCDTCDWRGVSKEKLNRHVQEKHIRDKVYPCEQCDYKAYRKDWLTAHIKNIHQN